MSKRISAKATKKKHSRLPQQETAPKPRRSGTLGELVPRAIRQGEQHQKTSQVFADMMMNLPPRLWRQALGDVGNPFSENSWVYAATMEIAKPISRLPFSINTGDVNNPEPIQENDPLMRLFRNPNGGQSITSIAELWIATVIYMYGMHGETFWVLIGKDAAISMPGEVPTEIWPRNGGEFRAVLHDKTKRLLGWVHRDPLTSTEVKLLPHEVVRFKFFNPSNPLRGFSPIIASAINVRTQHKALNYNEEFFDEGAQLGGLFSTEEMLDDEQSASFLNTFKDAHGGYRKAWRHLVLDSGMKYTQMSPSHKDMQFLENLKYDREAILAVMGVPKAAVTVYEDVNMATALAQRSFFWEDTLLPVMGLITDSLNAWFATLDNRGLFALFDTGSVGALQDDLDGKSVTADRLFKMGWTRNSINKRLNMRMESDAEGDVSYLPSGLIPAEFLSGGAEGGAVVATQLVAPPQEKAGDAPAATVKRLPRAEGQRIWAHIMRTILLPNEKKLRSKVKRHVMELRRITLRNFDEAIAENRTATVTPKQDGDDPAPSLDDVAIGSILFPRVAADDALKAAAEPIVNETLAASVGQVSSEIGIDIIIGEDNLAMRRFVQRNAASLVQTNATIRRQLRNQLVAGDLAGETIAQLQQRIKRVFNNATSRSLTIARTEVAMAQSAGRNIAFEEGGIKKTEWVTAGDEAVRESHAAQDGEVREIGEPFSNGLTYPSEIGGAAEEVINCRCVAVAIVE